jgi:hypothetical protein
MVRKEHANKYVRFSMPFLSEFYKWLPHRKSMKGGFVNYFDGLGGFFPGTAGTGGGGSAATYRSGSGGNGVDGLGGGGGATDGQAAYGGRGGNGVVIIRYPDTFPLAIATTGNPTITNPTGYRVYRWTVDGSITF